VSCSAATGSPCSSCTHARKGGACLRAGQALRGSSEFHAWGDSNLYLRRDGEALTLTAEHRAAPSSRPLDRKKLRKVRRREGRYLLRTNLTGDDPAKLWEYYIQLVAVEEAFRNLKGDLAIRPVFHQDETRIEAHIFISFLAYCLQITLTRRLHSLAPGLTARSVLEKFAAVQMIDVHLPTTDGREIVLTRFTEPEPDLRLLLDRLKLQLPAQPPPRIAAVKLLEKPLL
jgi:hypothetical protein